MAANTILTSIVTGGSNAHATVAEEANAYATDFVAQGVVGAIVLTTSSAGSGSFCVNADASPDMGVTILAGQAYIAATPSSQDAQVLRVRAATNYTTYTINANASGSTKYDWIYLKVDPTKANNPAADASDVTALFTSRSSSNTSDNGTPPTYGLLLAVVTVANAAVSITNPNISDKRFNTSIGTQNGSLIVTQAGTGVDAIVQAAGIDASVNLDLKSKGPSGHVQFYDNGSLVFNSGPWSSYTPSLSNLTIGNGVITGLYARVGKSVFVNLLITLGSTSSVGSTVTFTLPVTGSANYIYSGANGTTFATAYYLQPSTQSFTGLIRMNTNTTAQFIVSGVSGSFINTTGITSGVPFTWATGNQFMATFYYEAA